MKIRQKHAIDMLVTGEHLLQLIAALPGWQQLKVGHFEANRADGQPLYTVHLTADQARVLGVIMIRAVYHTEAAPAAITAGESG